MRFLCLIALATLAACSSQPVETPAPVLAASAIPAAPEASPAATAAAADAVDADEFKPPAGYRRKVEDGRIYYCAKVVVLGSRFPKEDCRTQSQLEQLEGQKALMKVEMERTKAVCSSALACGSN